MSKAHSNKIITKALTNMIIYEAPTNMIISKAPSIINFLTADNKIIVSIMGTIDSADYYNMVDCSSSVMDINIVIELAVMDITRSFAFEAYTTTSNNNLYYINLIMDSLTNLNDTFFRVD